LLLQINLYSLSNMAAARGDKEFKASQSTSVGGKKGGESRERERERERERREGGREGGREADIL
jgi:hypothetical protein